MDILQGWNITDFAKAVCLGNLRRHTSRTKCNFDGIAYHCDCIDFPVQKLFKTWPMVHSLQGVRCNNFYTVGGQRMPAIMVPLNELVCDLSDHCPSNCRCVYRPANATLHVYCSSADLASLPLRLPPLSKNSDKYKLDFSNNNLLRHLAHRPYFVNTSILDIWHIVRTLSTPPSWTSGTSSVLCQHLHLGCQ